MTTRRSRNQNAYIGKDQKVFPCMECGACAQNCPTGAITVKSGAGCANAVIHSMPGRKNNDSCCCVIEEKKGISESYWDSKTCC